ncbi:MAG: DUF4339 domain-containing protein [Deltaproteobacteria bacterium]|jgi:hypothetical protein|nr:DUF4339 domain-containing protein [Deltaproteobacteria bacterium]
MDLDLSNKSHSKKWYVSTNQGCLGPLSTIQLLNMGKKNEINSQNFVWHEGWNDWKAISQVYDLELLYANNDSIELESKVGLKVDSKLGSKAKSEAELENKDSWNSSDEFWKEIHQEIINFSPDEYTRVETISKDKNQCSLNLEVQPAKNINQFKTNKIILFLVLALLACFFIILKFTRGNSYKKSSYREYLEKSLTRNEYRELISAIDESLEKSGPAASIGIINNNERSKGLQIYFAVGTNLQDGTELKLNVWSTPGTLLSLNNVSVESKLFVKDGIAFSPAMYGKEGGPLAEGEYQVMVRCQKCKNMPLEENNLIKNQNEREITLAHKAYFIGGKKDSNYLEELKVIQDQINQKSKGELIEAAQLIGIIRKQFNELRVNQIQLTQGKNNRNRKENQNTYSNWNESDWIQIDEQLFVLIDRWKSLTLHNEVVHKELFGEIDRAYLKLKEIYEIQTKFSFQQKEAKIQYEKIDSLFIQTEKEISSIEKKL